MKKKLAMIVGFTLLVLFIPAIMKVGATDRPLTLMEQEYLTKIQIINREVENEMYYDCRNSNGDVNYEFLRRLQTLQRIMITTAQAEDRYGQDAVIKKYANAIIEDKQDYLEKIEHLIPQFQEKVTDDKMKESKYSSSYSEVYKKLTRSTRPLNEIEEIIRTKGVDREFLGRIIQQAEAMTEMLTLVHSHTQNEEVINFVESIAKEHQNQLDELYKLVN